MSKTIHNDKKSFLGGLIIKTVTVASGVTSTPTAAELTTKLGDPAALETGYLVKLIDTGNSKTYLVTTNGTGWNYVAMAAAS